MFGPCFDSQYFVSLLFLQSSILAEEKRAGFLSVLCLPVVLWLCTVPWVGLQCVIVMYMYFLVRFTFWSFHLYFNQNRSAPLCKLVSDNSLFAVNSMNYFTAKILHMLLEIDPAMASYPQAGVHFRTAVEHLRLTDMPFILHSLVISCMCLGLLAGTY